MTQSTTQNASPKISIGFMGTGWMGSTLLRRLAERDDVIVSALGSSDAQRAQGLLDQLGLKNTRIVSDFADITNDDSIDAVFLTNTNASHGPQSIAALRAGKHVFCEKPASTTFEDHLSQIELAKANPHLKTFVDYILNFDTFEQRLREMIERDDFGKITQAQINYRHPVNIAGNKAWKLKQEVMGDAIGMGINHAVSVLLRAMESQARPVKVFATSMNAQVRAFEADPIWNIHLEFDNGAAGVVLGNIDSSNGYDAFHSFSGTKGALVFDSILPRTHKVRMWNSHDADGDWFYPLDPDRCREQGVEPWPAETTTPDSGDVVEHQTAECVAEFIESIQEDRQSPLSFVNASVVAEVQWAARVSAELGVPVTLPLDVDLVRRTLSESERGEA